MTRTNILIPILAALLIGCTPQAKEQLYTKEVTFPEDATLEEKIDMAARLTPSKEQLAWQQMEFTAFLHFGINTFTDNEWGHGTDSPELFNPTELDCEQWVRALKDAGFKMAILTAKHHDGFCLWQTATTEYCVKNSPWREGKGDVVRELSDACKKHGIKFGVYLSPWDRNAPSYGDSPAYNRLFIAQLTELLTNYGRVDEVWFDGACAEGPNGKKQIYDWEAILSTIRELQPNAVTAIMGDDVRWVGNEGGLGRTTEWSATPYTPKSYGYSAEANSALGLEEMSKDLGSRELIAKAERMHWYPSEVDVSIRPGWFYHEWQDEQVRSLANLVEIYFSSVGRNSVLLLNIPPDRRGLIHEIDAARIKELREYIDRTFAKNFATNTKSYKGVKEGGSIILDIAPGATVNTLLIQEDISKGQRVEEFIIEAYINDEWHYIAQGTTIGYKRLIRFSDTIAEKIRVAIKRTRKDANISNIGLYYAELLSESQARLRISDIPTNNWRCVEMEAAEAIDGNRATTWHSEGLVPLVVDMGSEEDISGFCYAPTTDNELRGTIFKYRSYTSLDGKEWRLCPTSGEFSNIKHNPIPYFVHFGTSHRARYFKLEPICEIDNQVYTSIGEVGILK
jgi:alpha-L-fucosidase